MSGDREAFLNELKAVLQIRDYRVRVGGTIEVSGNHARAVREWLAGLGF